MKRNFLTRVAAVAVAASAIIFPTVPLAQTPTMGGGYKDVISIPVEDSNVKAIAGALFKPDGKGPFPAVIYMSGSSGIDGPLDRGLQEALIGHLRSEGFATLIVDPFTPRDEPFGISERLDGSEAPQYFDRGARGALAAVRFLRTKPEIDPQRVFLQGYSYGATSAVRAVDGKKATSRAEQIRPPLMR
jgi:dienelactone hydrolase